MKVIILLADSAQAVNGKLYVLGGGWSITGPNPSPSALAIKIEVPWDEANKKHKMKLQLLDTDGRPVIIPTPVGEQPLLLEGEFEVGRPPGLKPGTPIDFAAAFNMPPFPLKPDGRYVWKLWINGESNENWEVAFSTAPHPPESQAPRKAT